ncbi:MAG: hypothetical protein M3069_10655 [Chloroflexota bacterium]|nr:hypothetical protein [Chloroflexota bacterium]
MREFVELVDLSDHACTDPRVERMEVYEPIRMQAVWMSIFRCCSQVFTEPSEQAEEPPILRTLRPRIAAA